MLARVAARKRGAGTAGLRRLIEGRLKFTPTGDFYSFLGTGTMRPVLAGVQEVASQSTPDWNQIASFLESMQRLRDSVGFAG